MRSTNSMPSFSASAFTACGDGLGERVRLPEAEERELLDVAGLGRRGDAAATARTRPRSPPSGGLAAYAASWSRPRVAAAVASSVAVDSAALVVAASVAGASAARCGRLALLLDVVPSSSPPHACGQARDGDHDDGQHACHLHFRSISLPSLRVVPRGAGLVLAGGERPEGRRAHAAGTRGRAARRR